MISYGTPKCVHFGLLMTCLFVSLFVSPFTVMHHGVIAILGYDPVESTLYGVSRNGKAVFKITIDQSCESSKPVAVPQNVWDTAKAKDTTIVAVMLENDFAVTNTTITPLAEHTITSNSGTKWGGKDCYGDWKFVTLLLL